MPAAVQQQVDEGIVSATTALHVVRETRDAKNDPAFAAELIANAAEEKRRLGKKGRATPKAVRKALEKVREPKAPPPPPATLPVHAQPPEPESDSSSGLPATQNTNGTPIKECGPLAVFLAAKNIDVVNALRGIAEYANTNDLNQRGDDEVIEVFARDIKRVALVYARVMGGES
jgi:hypothetical protein